MFDNKITEIVNSGIETKGLNLLEDRPSVGSLSETDRFGSNEMHRFWLHSINIQESTITGSEPFPGEMLRPSSENVILPNSMIDLLVEYYRATYETLDFRRPFERSSSSDAVVIRVKMNRFGRCQIGFEVFGSVVFSQHVKSSYVVAKFITNNNEIDCYPE